MYLIKMSNWKIENKKLKTHVALVEPKHKKCLIENKESLKKYKKEN